MAEQQKIVDLTVGATDSRRRLTSSPIKLYSTTYEASYGRLNFPHQLGRCSGTHYWMNFRPALYRPSFSHTGKPSLRHLLLDSFTSQTKRDYRPRDSGLHQMRTFPKTDMSFVNTSEGLFVPHHPMPTASQSYVTVGRKGECGFTEGADLHLMTFQENNSGMVGLRQTGKSVMKSDFLPPSQLQGVEKFYGISNRFFQESGSTHGAIAPLTSPIKKSAPTEVFIGKKEPSGFVLSTPNRQVFPNTPFHCSDFVTHYQHDFCHHDHVRVQRSGFAGAGIIRTKNESGYSRHNTDRFIIKG